MGEEYKKLMVAMCLSDESWSTREDGETYSLTALKDGYRNTITCAQKSHPDQPNDLYDSIQIEERRREFSVHLGYTGERKLTPWNTFLMDPVLVNYDKGSVTVRQLRYETLDPGRWLGDEVIDFVTMIAVNENFSDQYCFPSTFTQTLNDREKELRSKKMFDLQSLTSSLIVSSRKFLGPLKKLPNLKTFKKIFFPFHVGSCHWALVYVDVVNRKMFLLDSLSLTTQSEKTINNLRFYLDDKLGHLTLTKAQHVPQQPNNYDCGLYCIFFALALTKSDGLPIKMPDSNVMRDTVKDFIWKRATTERTKTRLDYDFGQMKDITCTELSNVSYHRSIPSKIDTL